MLSWLIVIWLCLLVLGLSLRLRESNNDFDELLKSYNKCVKAYEEVRDQYHLQTDEFLKENNKLQEALSKQLDINKKLGEQVLKDMKITPKKEAKKGKKK